MTGKPLDSSAAGALILILPIAIILAIAYAAWPVLIALIALVIGLRLGQQWQWQRWRQAIDPTFNALVRENQGCLTPLDLAAKTDLSTDAARRFLEKKALEYGAQRKDFAERGSVYYFLTTGAIGSLFDQSEPDRLDLSALEAEPLADEELGLDSEGAPESDLPLPEGALIQAELAKRLQVHASTVYKRKADSDFARWSCNRDPDGTSWRYLAERKVFVPVDAGATDT